jgi:hypothetical protein
VNTGAAQPTVLGARLTELWTRTYTGGLDRATALTRREEIAADLHDQQAAARTAGIGPGPVSRAIATRMLLGIPADLSWRHQHLRAERAAGRKEGVMSEHRPAPGGRFVATALSVPVLVWSVYVGLGWTLTSEDGWTEGRWVGPVIIGGAIAALVGLLMLATGNTNGAYLVAVAAVTSTLWYVWMPPIPVLGLLSALGFVAYGVHARRQRVVSSSQPVPG